MTNRYPYRGFSIERELDGTFSIYGIGGYIAGGFATIYMARADADKRRDG